ncbi:hypothetical protein [Kineococcus terrestris]|uniref:hypothetical protein n=1 Tax=Kineococcus terrestris TaxID=2044856 RepID=UPI0034DB41C4
MELHVVYRSHGGENAKGRPDWYSKRLALASFVRAVEEAGVPVDVVHLSDGEPTPDRLDLMRAGGRVVTFRGGSNRRSYLRALDLARRSDWDDDDVVLLAEDDYLWRPDALRSLVAAAERRRSEYWAPYGTGTHDDLDGRRPPRANRGESHVPESVVRWVPHESTTSTFAARLGALRQDHRLMVLCCLSGGDFDLTTCLTLQGVPRFSLRDLVVHHPVPGSPLPKRAARWAYLAVLRAAVDLRALRRPSRRRVLTAADPAVCTHAETGWLAPHPAGRPDYWEAVAEDTRRWLAEREPVTTGTTGTTEPAAGVERDGLGEPAGAVRP